MTSKNEVNSKPCIYTGRGTIMLIRVLALETITQNYGSEIVFDDLRDIEAKVTQKIHNFGGLSFGNLKLGILAFFGWGSNITTEPFSHVSSALECAKALQKEAAQVIRFEPRIHHPLFLLQISLATGFYNAIKDGQNSNHHNGIIGEGVSLVQRVNEYCGIKSVIVTAETERTMQSLNLAQGSKHEIKILLPNSSQVINAYEYNTFGDDIESYRIVTNRIKASISRRVDQDRWNCVRGKVSVMINERKYKLLNISRGGLEIEGNLPHINGQLLGISFDNPDGSLKICSEKLDLGEVTCEVRWNKKREKNYHIGLMFIGLDQIRKDELISLVLSKDLKRAVVS
ncbi:MAG: PilZ domain-containing protein [Oligoflexus sp.]